MPASRLDETGAGWTHRTVIVAIAAIAVAGVGQPALCYSTTGAANCSGGPGDGTDGTEGRVMGAYAGQLIGPDRPSAGGSMNSTKSWSSEVFRWWMLMC